MKGSLREYIEAHPEMSSAELTKKLKCGKSTVSTARWMIRQKEKKGGKSMKLKPRPQKVRVTAQHNGVAFLDDVKVIKKIGITKVTSILAALNAYQED